MAATKYEKYIISDYKPSHGKQSWSATYEEKKEETHILYIGEDRLAGSFYGSSGWFWPAMMNRGPDAGASKPHSHPYDEVLGLVGTDPNNPRDLCGEARMTIGGEEYVITQSCLLYLPANVPHGPFKQTKIERPIIHFNFGKCGTHI
jgi:hypothetical protein